MTHHRHLKQRASGRQSQVAFSWQKVVQPYVQLTASPGGQSCTRLAAHSGPLGPEAWANMQGRSDRNGYATREVRGRFRLRQMRGVGREDSLPTDLHQQRGMIGLRRCQETGLFDGSSRRDEDVVNAIARIVTLIVHALRPAQKPGIVQHGSC
jgi:hypothetical protein